MKPIQFIFFVLIAIFSVLLLSYAISKGDKERQKRYLRDEIRIQKVGAFNAACQPYHYITTDQFDYIDVDINNCKIIYKKK